MGKSAFRQQSRRLMGQGRDARLPEILRSLPKHHVAALRFHGTLPSISIVSPDTMRVESGR